MSRENVESARRGYAALNGAYESGDVNDLLPFAEEMWEPDIVLKTNGAVLAGGEQWHGHEGMLRFTAAQMEAFSRMRIEPLEFIDAGDRLVVPVRFGGRARHTGLEIEFSAVHVFTMRNGKAVRIDMYETKAEALDAVGVAGDVLENEELVRRVFDAFHAGDFDRAGAGSAPGIEWDASRAAPDGGIYRGLPEIRAAWGRFQGAWEEHRVTIERAIEVGDRVIVVNREYGRGRGTGIEVDMRSADIYTVRAGKVTRVVSYADPDAALRDAGLSPENSVADAEPTQ